MPQKRLFKKRILIFRIMMSLKCELSIVRKNVSLCWRLSNRDIGQLGLDISNIPSEKREKVSDRRTWLFLMRYVIEFGFLRNLKLKWQNNLLSKFALALGSRVTSAPISNSPLFLYSLASGVECASMPSRTSRLL